MDNGVRIQMAAQINLTYPVQILGSRKERMGQGDAHAPSLVLLESSMRHTGGASEDAKSSGEVVRGNASRKLDASGESRMGQRSRRTGKPCTPGGGPMAKAPS